MLDKYWHLVSGVQNLIKAEFLFTGIGSKRVTKNIWKSISSLVTKRKADINLTLRTSPKCRMKNFTFRSDIAEISIVWTTGFLGYSRC